jgi:NADH-quinone oxidoreductase subunit F
MTADERQGTTTATLEEIEAVDAVLGPPPSAWTGGARRPRDLHVARREETRRDLLLPALTALARRVGYVSPGGLAYVARRLLLPPAEVYGVASFYALLPVTRRPAVTVHVCDDVACRLRGAEGVAAALQARWGPEGEPLPGSARTWMRSGCLGHCAAAPAVFVQRAGREPVEAVTGPADPQVLRVWADEGGELPPPIPTRVGWAPGGPGFLLERVGCVDPEDVDAYRAAGGFTALRRALDLGPEGVLREIREARLVGRGGAAFPTATKWAAVAQNPRRPHYLVCNADESEPGTFKDRVLLEEDPFAVIEGMIIAAYTVGAARGYLFVRGEYPLALRRVTHAVEQARRRGLLGEQILGRPFAFDIEIRVGAGAYVCGEETALFNAIEGRRAEPRNKPPFPAARGLFGQPTVINNVETLANIPVILRLGGLTYARTGTADGTGTRLFSVSGCVRTPGLYEVPFGTPLGALLDLAGGLPEGRRLRAVLLGGAAGGFVGPDALDMPLSPDGVRRHGATLGSGAVVVFDDTADLGAVVRRIARFFRDESCGQCVPCRVGTVRQEELVDRLLAGRPQGSVADEVRLHEDLAAVMRDASICGLGQTAANAVESAIRLGLLTEGEGRR